MSQRPQQPTAVPWRVQPADPYLVQSLAKHLGCPPAVAHVLVTRGIENPQAAESFFHPKLSDLHDPALLLGMTEAVARIQRAVLAREPILVYGDYDVDGTTATVLLKTAIDRITLPADASAKQESLVSWHVPHRIREGYGLQTTRLAQAAAEGIRLVISVDTGIRAFGAAAEAKALGLDLIVTDHHLPDDTTVLPEALAVINPAQTDCPYPFKHLCGAAVAFKLAHALLLAHASAQPDTCSALRRLNERLLPSFLKLVAIATIADSVPLIGENRSIAALGLRELRNAIQPGLRALMQVSSIPPDRAPTAAEIGFRIGPRINAAGRMDIADDVIELFLTRSTERATELAQKLDQLNEDRRATERAALEQIDQHLASLLDDSGRYPPETLVLDHPEWHRGVLGILASRVVERTGRPALVLTREQAEAHGSGRSVSGYHLLDALTAAHTAECDQLPAARLFSRFGGHAHAVGFSLPSAHLDLLRARLRAHASTKLHPDLLGPPLLLDAEIAVADLTEDLVDFLDRCAPFGNQHQEPLFLTRSLTLAAPVRIIKDTHICLSLVPAPGNPPIQALGWTRRTHWPTTCASLSLAPGSKIDAACHLRRKQNRWFTGIELELVDMKLAST